MPERCPLDGATMASTPQMVYGSIDALDEDGSAYRTSESETSTARSSIRVVAGLCALAAVTGVVASSATRGSNFNLAPSSQLSHAQVLWSRWHRNTLTLGRPTHTSTMQHHSIFYCALCSSAMFRELTYCLGHTLQDGDTAYFSSYLCGGASCKSITAHNEYTRVRGFAGKGYGHLSKGMLIEPHRTTTLHFILPAGQTLGDSTPQWSAFWTPNDVKTEALDIINQTVVASFDNSTVITAEVIFKDLGTSGFQCFGWQF